jgi:hypothetical protein
MSELARKPGEHVLAVVVDDLLRRGDVISKLHIEWAG